MLGVTKMNCKKCNTTVEDGTTFCPQCGAAIGEEGSFSAKDSIKRIVNNVADETAAFDPKDIADNKAMGGLAYFLFFLPLLACPNSRYGRFHANQGLLLLIAGFAGGIVNTILTQIILAISWRLWFLPSLIGLVIWVPLFILFIIGLINGFGGKAKSLPIIGKFQLIKDKGE